MNIQYEFENMEAAFNKKEGMQHWYWEEQTAYVLLKKYKMRLTKRIVKKEWKETGPQGWFIQWWHRPKFTRILDESISLSNRIWLCSQRATAGGVEVGDNMYVWYFKNEELAEKHGNNQNWLVELVEKDKDKEKDKEKEIFPQATNTYAL